MCEAHFYTGKGCDKMNRRKRYRRFVLWCLGLDLMAMGLLGYHHMETRATPGRTTYVSASPVGERQVLVSGSTVGIYMETEGVLVIDTGEIITQSGDSLYPAKNIVQPGDYIMEFNGDAITTKRELMQELSHLDSGNVTLKIRRDEEIIPVSITPVKDVKGKFKLGIWVRDDTQGIGTLTFVDEQGNYGALGHGISDVDTGELLNIQDGALYQAEILGVKKGSKGSPGEMSGLIRYEQGKVIGRITSNSKNGIYGSFLNIDRDDIYLKRMCVAEIEEISTGPASILCCIDGQVQEFEASITEMDTDSRDTNKSFIIQVTDQRLLDATGGIIQGMSGSPVVQNGKFVGAVTHVFVQDSTSGYGIFAENMLKEVAKSGGEE